MGASGATSGSTAEAGAMASAATAGTTAAAAAAAVTGAGAVILGGVTSVTFAAMAPGSVFEAELRGKVAALEADIALIRSAARSAAGLAGGLTAEGGDRALPGAGTLAAVTLGAAGGTTAEARVAADGGATMAATSAGGLTAGGGDRALPGAGTLAAITLGAAGGTTAEARVAADGWATTAAASPSVRSLGTAAAAATSAPSSDALDSLTGGDCDKALSSVALMPRCICIATRRACSAPREFAAIRCCATVQLGMRMVENPCTAMERQDAMETLQAAAQVHS